MSRAGRCYDCFRPIEACFCESIPHITNRTDVLILQHRQERFHRFNTARIVSKALQNSLLLADHTPALASRLQLKPGAGLLFPAAPCEVLSDVSPDRYPVQLVILDGTWSQAKTLLRDLPVLQSLPRFRLAPAEPSRYRIRREPNAVSLSTVEATVAALRILEPETTGFDDLLGAFDAMIDTQLRHPGSANGARFKKPRSRIAKHAPLSLLGSLEHVVVAYGEAAAGERGRKPGAAPPLSWVACRLGDGAVFSILLRPQRPLDDVFLRHLELTRGDFTAAVSLEEAQSRWRKFIRPRDLVVVSQPGTARLYSFLAGERAACFVLKSIDFASLAARASPAAAVLSLPYPLPSNLGRAGKRLADAIESVMRLNALSEP